MSDGLLPQPEYAGAVEDALVRCRDRFAAEAFSVYLTGSVATGEALVGVSDVDLFCFHRDPAGAGDDEWANQACADLRQRHGAAAVEVHLNVFTWDRLRQESFWRFMLRYNSVRLMGPDLFLALEQEGYPTPLPSPELAIARRDFVKRCLEQALAGQKPDSLCPLPANASLAARKLVRNFILVEGAYLLMLDGHFTSFRRSAVVPQIRRHFPQWQKLYDLGEYVMDHPYDSGVTPSGFMAACEPFVRFILTRLKQGSADGPGHQPAGSL